LSNEVRRKVPALFLLQVLLLFLVFCSQGAAKPVSEEDYDRRIHEAIELLEATQGPLRSEEVSRLRILFPRGLEIRPQEGEAFRVDLGDLNRWIREAAAPPGGRARLRTYLEALREQTSMAVRVAPRMNRGWEDCRKELKAVFNRKEFEGLREKPVPAWRRYIAELLGRIIRWFSGSGLFKGFSAGWIVYPAYGIVIILGLLILVWIIRRSDYRGRFRRRSHAPSRSPTPSTSEKEWPEWRREAGESALRGDYRQAVRAFFVSVLMEGHERGWWSHEPSATNREHLARLKGPPAMREAFLDLISRYEGVWYGHGRADEETFRACENALQKMRLEG